MTHADDKRITLLLRGELSESEAAEVMEHIAKCDECADRMADLTLDMACVDPPAGMNEDIRESGRGNMRGARDDILRRVQAHNEDKRHRHVEDKRQEPLDKPVD